MRFRATLPPRQTLSHRSHHGGPVRKGKRCSLHRYLVMMTLTDSPSRKVNTQDDNEPETPTTHTPSHTHNNVPNSPPPSFHSRESSILSRDRNETVDPALADAFDTEGDDSDDEPDDRQRLVRGNSFPINGGATPRSGNNENDGTARPAPARQVTQLPQAGGSATPFRVYGGGIQSDGVFSNLAAKPEVGAVEKEEMPPVCALSLLPAWVFISAVIVD